MHPISLELLEQIFSVMERDGVSYELGGKASSLTQDSHDIESIDCSGFVRFALAKASGQQFILPDGSQMQREWCEQQGLHQLAHYSDVTMADPSRLFICFIKPNTNGCGPTGHVWLVRKVEGQEYPTTLESHGGKGVDSRLWNYRTLVREFYSAFELPTTA